MTAPRERNRWAIVATYALVASANQMLWLTFAPITTASAHYYGVSEGTIGWLSEIFPLIYVILAVPAAAALDRWFRPALAGGAALTAIGALVRLGGPTFAWAMAGQLLIAVAQPLVLNAVTGVASGYLTVASRPLGISLGSAGVFLGILISLVLGAALGGSRLHALLVIGAVYGVLAAISLLATLAPAGPPAGQASTIGLDGLRAVWHDRLIRRLAAVAFVGFGIFVALTTWLQPLLHPAGISSRMAGWLLVGMVLAGVAGAAILSAPVIRAGAAQTLFRVTAAVTGGVCIAIAVWQWVPLIAIGVGLAGFLLLASLPVILELAERRAGPAGTSATALVWLSGNAGGIVIALLVQAVVHHRLIAFLLMAAVAASVLPFVRADPESVPPEHEPAAVSAPALNRSRLRSGHDRNRTGVDGFAGRCVATPPRRRGM